jgi:LytS/YehU family sensor histidine kinase
MQLELQNLRLNTDLKSIYAQINPHFIFNTLSTTAYFIRKNRNKEATDHVLAFSRLLRSYITSTRQRSITIAEEAKHIENYISLQLLRFENKCDYMVEIDEKIDAEHKEIPPLLLQPIVENAINHGLVHTEYKGLLKVTFKQGSTSDEILCIIDDNGIGRKASKQLTIGNNTSPSFGSKLIQELITAINSYNRWHIEIMYEDKELPGSGTAVKITIQYL